jgi:hypothetical protein
MVVTRAASRLAITRKEAVMRIRPGGPVKKYGRLRVYDDHLEVRARLRRWRIDRTAPLPMHAEVTTRGTIVYQDKTTLTRVAAGTWA